MTEQSDCLNQEEKSKLIKLKKVLESAGINYSITSHAVTLVTPEDGVENGVGNLDEMAPTLILKTEKGFLAAIISGDRRLSYKKIKKELGLKNISLADPDTVLRISGSEIGTVSLVNIEIPTIVDLHLREIPFAYGGCGIARHTLKIAPDDLIRITNARVFNLTEPK